MRTVKTLVCTALAAMAGGVGAVTLLASASRPGSEYAFFDPIIEIKKILDQRYVEAPDAAKLQAGAIKGMIEVLDDPYTVYVPPAETTEFTKDLTGEYVGIGAAVNIVDGWLVITSPLEDSPAFRAGLMADDRVVEIDGKSTFGLAVDECVRLLSGTPGTSVTLTIERAGQKMPMTISRDRIKTRAVKGFQRDPADTSRWNALIDPERRIGYVRLSQFTPGCADELARTIEDMGASKGELKGLVLDLRWNPGGLLDEARKIADLFLKEGVIVSTRGRAYAEEVARAQAEGTLPDFPLVVLINGQSASASEVLSGALVENNRAITVGTRSFGKGLVQSVMPVPYSGGGEIKITEQRYYLPSGRCIQRSDDSAEWGVDPSAGFYVPLTDEQMLELLKVRRQDDILSQTGTGEKWSDANWILDHFKDPQLAAAVKAVQLRIDGGSWQATGQTVDVTKEVASGELKRILEARERMARDLIRLDKREQALEQAAGASAPTAPDFWPDSADLAGGKLTITDKNGDVVSTLRITGNNLERWLFDADVVSDAATSPGAGAAPVPAPSK